jgi:flagellar basal-body rod protein FlgB
MSIFNSTIDMLRQATAFARARHEILAQNIANADTPGFQARDLTFEHELSLAQKVRALPTTSMGAPDLDVRLIEAPDARLGIDGNNVDIDRQMTRVAQNTLYHNVVVQLLSSRFNSLKTAINGHA